MYKLHLYDNGKLNPPKNEKKKKLSLSLDLTAGGLQSKNEVL